MDEGVTSADDGEGEATGGKAGATVGDEQGDRRRRWGQGGRRGAGASEGERATAEKVCGTGGVAAQSRRVVGPRSLGLPPIAQWFDWTDT